MNKTVTLVGFFIPSTTSLSVGSVCWYLFALFYAAKNIFAPGLMNFTDCGRTKSFNFYVWLQEEPPPPPHRPSNRCCHCQCRLLLCTSSALILYLYQERRKFEPYIKYLFNKYISWRIFCLNGLLNEKTNNDHINIKLKSCRVERWKCKLFKLSNFNFAACVLQLANPLKLDQILFNLIKPC